MRAAITTRPAARSAQATRRDLLLETLALRHQLGVLAGSNKRLRPVDRLFWLFLRWLWPRWREALMLIQPSHCRSLASRRRTSMLASPFTTSWKATHRFNLSRSDSADGRRELSLGRAADPWLTTEAWNHHFGTHRLSLSAWPPDHPVTNMADIPGEHLRQPDVYLAGDVGGCRRGGNPRRRL